MGVCVCMRREREREKQMPTLRKGRLSRRVPLRALEEEEKEKDGRKNAADVTFPLWHLAPEVKGKRHVVHRRTARTSRPSALVHFCFLSSFSYLCLPILPSFPSSDLARALSPREQGKSFWQTDASVEGGKSCQGKGKKREQGQEEEYETETRRRTRREGSELLHVPTSLFLTCQIANCRAFGTLGLLFNQIYALWRPPLTPSVSQPIISHQVATPIYLDTDTLMSLPFSTSAGTILLPSFLNVVHSVVLLAQMSTHHFLSPSPSPPYCSALIVLMSCTS